jgi:hypothetical protein
MKRPREHEIEDISKRIFEKSLPDGWIAQELHPDYGLDYRIEIFENENSTGYDFYIQLKGKSKINIDSSDNINLDFSVEHLKYYYELKNPVFIIIVDINKEECYFIDIQFYINRVLSNENPNWMNQEKVRIKIPLNNKFPIDNNDIKKKILTIFKLINSINNIIPSSISEADFKNILKNEKSFSKFKEIKQIEFDELEIHEISFIKDKNERILRITDKIKEYDGEERYDSLAKGIYILGVNLNEFYDSDIHYFINVLESYKGNLSKIPSRSLKLLVQGFYEYFKIIFYYTELLNVRILFKSLSYYEQGDEIFIYPEIIKFSKLVNEAINKFYSILDETFTESILDVSCYLISYITRFYLYAYVAIEREIEKESLIELENYILNLIDVAEDIAIKIDRPELICFALQNRAQFYADSGIDDYESVLKDMREIAVENGLNNFIEASENLLETFNELNEEKKKLIDKMETNDIDELIEEFGEEKIEEFHKLLAEKAGIDLDDKNDMSSRIARIGLKDRNPQRVLQNANTYIYK